MSYDVLAARTTLYNRWRGSLLFVYQRVTPDIQTGAPVTDPASQVIDPNLRTPFYDDAITFGLSMVGVPPTGSAPTDGDVARASTRWIAFLDLAEYRLIQNLIGSFTDTTESDFGRSASYGELADRWEKRTEQLLKQYPQLTNPYRGGASSGPSRHIPPTAGVPRIGPGYGGPWGYRRGPWGC